MRVGTHNGLFAVSIHGVVCYASLTTSKRVLPEDRSMLACSLSCAFGFSLPLGGYAYARRFRDRRCSGPATASATIGRSASTTFISARKNTKMQFDREFEPLQVFWSIGLARRCTVHCEFVSSAKRFSDREVSTEHIFFTMGSILIISHRACAKGISSSTELRRPFISLPYYQRFGNLDSAD